LVRNIAIGAAIGAIVCCLVFYWVLKCFDPTEENLQLRMKLAAENQQLLASYEEILNANKDWKI